MEGGDGEVDSKKEKRMADSYEITQAVCIGDKEVVFGIDEAKEMPYLCGLYTSNALFGAYEDCCACDDYVEAVELFAERLREQCREVRREQAEVTVPREKITVAMCLPLKGGDELQGKIVAVKPDMIKPEYRSAEHQGEVRPESLPQWAKEKAAEIQKQKTERKNNFSEKKDAR